jgi:hypothetical protein
MATSLRSKKVLLLMSDGDMSEVKTSFGMLGFEPLELRVPGVSYSVQESVGI